MILRLQKLTAEAFAPFGQVIEMDSDRAIHINDGRTEKFAGLAELVSLQDARFSLHRYRSKATSLPLRVEKLERHVLGHQAFIPLHSRPFPVVVAAAGPPPTAERVCAFISNGKQGVNLSPGTWHHYQISLEEGSQYLVLERSNAGQDCEQVSLDEPLMLSLEGA